ncbi:hypothetical protein BK133_30425 [Paenibacillus sp. FSL H8-0548]|uniref:hypothetical protein n=1 Tax=Paenibacillus sp. FSL H8-0548 TaxID=1920422 RepID=UPI00096E14BC|nr:hypothetical protein [Paenibacillus sp. FSL H8-0548]OMF18525.1 hypothetical protein BK133_30425 [Paenibacillus sp. FSL H8-0548]
MQTTLKENLLGIGIAVTIVSGIAVWGGTYIADKVNAGPSKIEAATSKMKPIHIPNITFVEYSSESRAIKKLKQYHALFDLKVTGGGIENYTPDNDAAWNDFLKSEVFDPQQYRTIGSELAELQGLEIDMQNLIELAAIANEKHDPDALRYMHRILHDLDLYAFPEDESINGDYWGVTNTAPAPDNTNYKEITDFMSSNT